MSALYEHIEDRRTSWSSRFSVRFKSLGGISEASQTLWARSCISISPNNFVRIDLHGFGCIQCPQIKRGGLAGGAPPPQTPPKVGCLPAASGAQGPALSRASGAPRKPLGLGPLWALGALGALALFDYVLSEGGVFPYSVSKGVAGPLGLPAVASRCTPPSLRKQSNRA